MSSRAAKAAASTKEDSGSGGAHRQRPEYYMDEEDISEAGIAPKIVTARAEFSDLGKKAPAPTKRGDWMGSLDDVVVSSSSNTIGAKLLRIMGWKDGQGVGQRIDSRTLAHLRAKERVRAAETGRVPLVGKLL